MPWTDEDETAVTAKVDALDAYEINCRDILDKIRNCSRNLRAIAGETPKDVDGTDLADARRGRLKTSLFTAADELLAQAGGIPE